LKIKLIAIIISILLVTSSISISSIDAVVIAYNIVDNDNNYNDEKNSNVSLGNKISSHQSKAISISLTENIGIDTGEVPTEDSFVSSDTVLTHTMLDLSDGLFLAENNIDRQIFLSPTNQFQAMMERILNSQSTRSDKRKLNSAVGSSILSVFISEIPDDSSSEKILSQNFLELFDSQDAQFYEILDSLIETTHQASVNYENLLLDDLFVLDDSLKDFGNLFNQVFDTSNPSFALALFLVSVYVLVRSENESIKFAKIKSVLSFILIVILMSSAIFTPLSISQSYWGMALRLRLE